MQGGSREQIYALHGWPWGGQVFRCDTAFLMDQRTFRVPWYEVLTHYSAHQRHRFVSWRTPHAPIISSYCAGYPTRYTHTHRRPGWGLWYPFVMSNGSRARVRYELVRMNECAPYLSKFKLIIELWDGDDGEAEELIHDDGR
jgi:hypothetical protein